MAEQHAIGGRQRQRVAGALLPGQVLGPRHQLARLHAAELREGAVRRLVAPDALARARTSDRRRCTPRRRRRPGCSGRRPRRRPSSASPWRRPPRRCRTRRSRRCGTGCLWTSNGEIGLAEAGPDAVVVDARRHHEDQHLVLADRRGSARPRAASTVSGGPWRSRRIAQAYIFAGTWPERRDLADLVEVLGCPRPRRRRRYDVAASAGLRTWPGDLPADAALRLARWRMPLGRRIVLSVRDPGGLAAACVRRDRTPARIATSLWGVDRLVRALSSSSMIERGLLLVRRIVISRLADRLTGRRRHLHETPQA